MAESGFVYALINPSMPDLVKIGRTSRDPTGRADELSASTGIPTPFVLIYFDYFEDCHAAEAYVHTVLEERGQRLADNREFFTIEVPDAIRLIASAPGNAGIRPSAPAEPEVLSDIKDVGSEDLSELAEFSLDDYHPANPGDDLYHRALTFEIGFRDEIQDFSEARRLYHQAAKLGSSDALLKLGEMYYYASGVPEDHNQALDYFKKAVSQGNYYGYLQMWEIFLNNENLDNARKCLSRFFSELEKKPLTNSYTSPVDSFNSYLFSCAMKKLRPTKHNLFAKYRNELIVDLEESINNPHELASPEVTNCSRVSLKWLRANYRI